MENVKKTIKRSVSESLRCTPEIADIVNQLHFNKEKLKTQNTGLYDHHFVIEKVNQHPSHCHLLPIDIPPSNHPTQVSLSCLKPF